MSGHKLPSVSEKLRALILSPSGHLLVNAIALVWVFVTDVNVAELTAVSTFLADKINTAIGNAAVGPDILANVLQWSPAVFSILVDLGSSFQINAALLEYKGAVRAAVNKARGGVQGDISNVPEEEKEAIFAVLEQWELKSVRDAFALLRRHILVGFVSLGLWAAMFAAALVPSIAPHLPKGMGGQLFFVVLAKALVLLYWWSYNIWIRPVRLYLFRVE